LFDVFGELLELLLHDGFDEAAAKLKRPSRNFEFRSYGHFATIGHWVHLALHGAFDPAPTFAAFAGHSDSVLLLIHFCDPHLPLKRHADGPDLHGDFTEKIAVILNLS